MKVMETESIGFITESQQAYEAVCKAHEILSDLILQNYKTKHGLAYELEGIADQLLKLSTEISHKAQAHYWAAETVK